MTSDIRRKSNRANAKRSTGPTTTNGKARAARNAYRHGLSVPLSEISAETDALVREMLGQTASAELIELARPIVAAQLALARVRSARQTLIKTELENPHYTSRRAIKQLRKYSLILARSGGIFTASEFIKGTRLEPEGPNKYAMIVCDLTKRLAALERYERRALSRRKFAIRALDNAGLTWPKADIDAGRTERIVIVARQNDIHGR